MEKLQGLLRWMRWLALACLLAGAANSSLAAKTYSDNGDGTVTDPTTGLIWMRCSMGQTWDGTTCTGTASNYVWAPNVTATFAGHSDWRVPNIRELQTIVNRAVPNIALDVDVFPNSASSYFWSSSAYVGYSTPAWSVDFSDGSVLYKSKNSLGQLRLVRPQNSLGLMDIARPSTDYVDQGDGSVTHTPTSLTWQRCAVGQSWTGSICNGSASTFTWDAARLLTSSFAGKTDWR